MRTALVLSLAPLFAQLLAGCITSSSCDGFKGGTYEQKYELTPDEYLTYAHGGAPQATGGPTDTGADTGTGTGTGGSPHDTHDSEAEPTGGPLSQPQICQAVCLDRGGQEPLSCSVGEFTDGENVTITCEFEAFCEGRRHTCVRSHGGSDGSAATWLARAAHDEAASIYAFLALAAELTAHGAPADLIARVRDAAADEARHARLVDRLAREHHAPAVALDVAFAPPRDLLAIAVENAVEGCVRETWAALSAAHQARHAHDPRHRALYQMIAADEARHAELAWALDAWLLGQLTPADHARVEAARGAAARELRAALAGEPYGHELAALGLPDPRTAHRLAASLDAALWSGATPIDPPRPTPTTRPHPALAAPL
ncbi:MAG: ferritin-like domain-containing protein [Myxococcales bacterium]|nr:ferritin-like domain-containing protein [Myxococcales bacterium]